MLGKSEFAHLGSQSGGIYLVGPILRLASLPFRWSDSLTDFKACNQR